jgi:RNA polymerase sigma-70 factor (ECF subfamily)
VIAPPGEEILALERALSELERRDQRAASVVELHHFGGLTYDEVGLVLGISPSTVKRDLRVAHAWLQRELTTISNAN